MAKATDKQQSNDPYVDANGGPGRPPVNSPIGTQDVGSPAWERYVDPEGTAAIEEADAKSADPEVDEKESAKAQEKANKAREKRAKDA